MGWLTPSAPPSPDETYTPETDGEALESKVRFPKKLEFLFEKHRYKVLHGGRGGSKCLAVGTEVIMYDGSLRKVEDVKVGDLLMGPDSKPRKVLDTVKGYGPLYKVRQSSGIDYVVNEGHILSVKKSISSKKDTRMMSSGRLRSPKGRYPSWPDITNVPVEAYASQSKRWQANFRGYRCGLVKYPIKPVLIDPYFLGVWLGDGTGRELRITTMDDAVIDYCRGVASAHGGDISISSKTDYKARDIGFPIKVGRENPIWKKFKVYSLPNNKHIPQDYMANCEEYRLSLLAGIIDTDGTRHANGYYSIAQVNKKLADDIKYLADGLGFRTSITERKTICTNNGKKGVAWYINISGDAWRIPCKIKCKIIRQSDIKPNKDYKLSQITIDPLGKGKWAGFAIDGDHLFLLKDGTVTHNSWGIARALLLQGTQRPLKILCVREIQSSIKESVHALLEHQIIDMNLQDRYIVLNNEIRGINGTQINFEGLRFNTNKIKSYEGIDIAWVEEAATVTKLSWETLIPTIRNEGSEIWVSFNPELDEDETYRRFVLHPPANASVVQVNWRDNPYFPEVLRIEKDTLKEDNYDDYLHVWEGKCRQTVQGAVYADELREARKQNRITRVPYNPGKPVHVFFDLGHADNTAMWFIQQDYAPGVFRVIDFYADKMKKMPFYTKILQEREYVYGVIYLPHDGNNDTIATDKTPLQQLEAVGMKVELVPAVPVPIGLNAVRTVFPMLYFDEERCSTGLSYLRRYKYKVNPVDNRYSKVPQHDENSHAADALKTFAIGWTMPAKPQKKKAKRKKSWLEK